MKLLTDPVAHIVLVRTLQASILALAVHWLLHWPLTGPHALGLFFTPLLCLYFMFVFVAPWRWGLPILTHLPAQEPIVALTFDDGPSLETTPRILDVLEHHHAQATFFVLGEQVRRHPDLVRRIVAEGHDLGIHGDTHRPFVLLTAAQVREEIVCARAAIRQAYPEAADVVWLRPPYGFKTLFLPRKTRRQGCRMVAWSLDSQDYRSDDAAAIALRVLSRLRPGAIVLLHDGATNRASADALPEILRGIAERGYRCVTLPRCADR